MDKNTPAPSRRGFLWGAAATGAAATAAATLPQLQPAQEAAIPDPVAKPEKGGGYRLSEHVKHYYRTTRI